MCVSCMCVCIHTGLHEKGGKGRHSDWAVHIGHLGVLTCGELASMKSCFYNATLE